MPPQMSLSLTTGNKDAEPGKGRRKMSNHCKNRVSEGEEYVRRPFDAYIKRVLKNNVKSARDSRIRMNRRLPVMPLDSVDGFPAPPLDLKVEQTEVLLGRSSMYLKNERLAKVINGMADRYKKVLEMAFVLEYPEKEIAGLLHIAPHTVHQYLYDALHYMKDAMEEEDEGQD